MLLLLSLMSCGDTDNTTRGGYYVQALVDAICTCQPEVEQPECQAFVEQNVLADFSVSSLSEMEDFCVNQSAQDADCYSQLEQSALNCEPLVPPECEALAALEPC